MVLRRGRFMSSSSLCRGRAALASSALLVLLLCFSSSRAHPAKPVDPKDPAVVAVKAWFETDLDAKYNNTNEVVHFCDAQRQVVSGYNYIFTMLVRSTYGNDTVEWLLHQSKIYERPAWDTSDGPKYEVTRDEVPVFEDADLKLPEEVTRYIETQLAASAESVETSEVVEHYEQRVEVEHVTMNAKEGSLTNDVEIVTAHRVFGRFVVGATKRDMDVSFVTKEDGSFVFFDSVDLGVSEFTGGGGEDGGILPYRKDVKLLTMKTSLFGIFLVGVLTCCILLVHFFRKRQKKSKEDWYIEQLTDIDEL
mmetsp:Transcript_6043/g.11085  ORF Transcript_6043/g.11085 Transcript_6043/m.11085 type:complete len:307 (+) Transcript_6043:267-1187(+)|eukprot:CAMPEP_0197481934 /NCGR_PEP_ID=MMETSP1309-20131121/50626_1 /TAXON_ID=464262 /ORGANISM="Genus nov. species nov., Strain RCC998" /LENGTH=306 /DNA_ID=CAMNT_0043024319 /DNA_START=211 /DNA_END=1131 /DNA_ORIENTATION=+